jgi:hypothetical protein
MLNKKEIIVLLPDYVQNKLDPHTFARIKQAVETDALLASKCADLRNYYASIESLPTLKAPTGFAARVMRNIEATQEKKSIVYSLFKPFHLKLPIESAAVLLTLTLLIMIYHPFQRFTSSKKATVSLVTQHMEDNSLSQQQSTNHIKTIERQTTKALYKTELPDRNNKGNAFVQEQNAPRGLAKAKTIVQPAAEPEMSLAMADKKDASKEKPLAFEEEKKEVNPIYPASQPVQPPEPQTAASPGSASGASVISQDITIPQKKPIEFSLALNQSERFVSEQNDAAKVPLLEKKKNRVFEVGSDKSEEAYPSTPMYDVDSVIRNYQATIIKKENDNAKTIYTIKISATFFPRFIKDLLKLGKIETIPLLSDNTPEFIVIKIQVIKP